MKRKNFLSILAQGCALLLVIALLGCNTGNSSDSNDDADDTTPTGTTDTTPVATPETPAAASASQVFGIYSGSFDGKSAEFMCSGSDCLITVGGKTYAKGIFTNLSTASASARSAGFTASLKITEKVDATGLLCGFGATVSAPLIFVFPSAGSTDLIKITEAGITTDLTRVATCVVTFDHQNNDYSSIPVKAGASLDLSDPIYNSIAKGSYSLMDWCLDKACTTPAPKPMTVSADVTLYAKWSMKTLAVPAVTLTTDGFSVDVSAMPEGTEGFSLTQVNGDGTYKSDSYYRNANAYINGLGKDFKAPVVYPFVDAGKTYRWYVQFYGTGGYTNAVTPQFSVTPTNGMGELLVSNEETMSAQIVDGKASLSALPVFTGGGVSSVEGSFSYWEILKGNGWESENWKYIRQLQRDIAAAATPVDLFPYLISNRFIPFPSGSKCFAHFVDNIIYKGDNCYRVISKTSAVYTYNYTAQWHLLPTVSPDITYTLETIADGVRLTVTSNPDGEDLYLAYYCDAAQGKSCTFSIPVKNVAVDTQEIVGYVCSTAAQTRSYLDITSGSSVTLVVNNADKLLTESPTLYVGINQGSFEIKTPTVTEN